MTDLARLARRLADDPLRWACQVRHDPAGRTVALIHEDAGTTAWLACWLPGQDDERCSGAVAVVRGAVRAEGPATSQVLWAGQGLELDGAEVHRLVHHGTEPTVTVHAQARSVRHPVPAR